MHVIFELKLEMDGFDSNFQVGEGAEAGVAAKGPYLYLF